MPVTAPSVTTGLTITNPLVLYRALIATKRIDPDPSQYRLALHLQKLYFRLKDYEPEIEYGRRLKQISHAVDRGNTRRDQSDLNSPVTQPGVISSLLAQKERRDTLAMTRSLTDHDSALELDSPQGLLLHGEVGTGKSMLVDLLADCLPNKKKRRWHFNTFMLETFARLEHMRRSSLESPITEAGLDMEEHSLLRLAREMISTSPILFLDEFQLPDRAASKILSNLLTSFFHLGGVLIATSNRMPEELAKASGVEFAPPPAPVMGILSRQFGFGTTRHEDRRGSASSFGNGDFAGFLNVLKARCEVWAMEGAKDWRRRDFIPVKDTSAIDMDDRGFVLESPINGLDGLLESTNHHSNQATPESTLRFSALPQLFFLSSSKSFDRETSTKDDTNWESAVLYASGVSPVSSAKKIPWEAAFLPVYGRSLCVPHAYQQTTLWTFDELCGTTLGPADYISLASAFHTVILTDVPVLKWHHKNEARRFITLLDALYEARCRLLVRAESGPDELFFPSSTSASSAIDSPLDSQVTKESNRTDEVYPETFAEIHQDLTAPFRPNISTYNSEDPSSRRTDRGDPDEDSDFGPLPGAGHEIGSRAVDFGETAAFTGEDERFAYLRAQSRLWEMCGRRWWDARNIDAVETWWRPLAPELRRWEHRVEQRSSSPTESENRAERKSDDGQRFRDGGSPFRTSTEKPPKFEWQHFWGLMKWGRKAGSWGQGVDGLSEKRER